MEFNASRVDRIVGRQECRLRFFVDAAVPLDEIVKGQDCISQFIRGTDQRTVQRNILQQMMTSHHEQWIEKRAFTSTVHS